MEDSIIARIPLFERMSPEEREELRGMMAQTYRQGAQHVLG